MSFDLPTSAIEQLKGFVLLCRTKPEIIHKPELKFFLDFLVSMGASIPPPPPASEAKPEEEKKAKPEEPKEEAPKEETPEVRELPSYLYYPINSGRFYRSTTHKVHLRGGKTSKKKKSS